MNGENPYESPKTAALPRDAAMNAGVRWRIAPTLFFGSLGIVGTGIGLVFVVTVVQQFATIWPDPSLREILLEDKSRFGRMIGIPILILTWGTCWTTAAFASWRRRWRVALIAIALGTVAIIVAINLPIPKWI